MRACHVSSTGDAIRLELLAEFAEVIDMGGCNPMMGPWVPFVHCISVALARCGERHRMRVEGKRAAATFIYMVKSYLGTLPVCLLACLHCSLSSSVFLELNPPYSRLEFMTRLIPSSHSKSQTRTGGTATFPWTLQNLQSAECAGRRPHLAIRAAPLHICM